MHDQETRIRSAFEWRLHLLTEMNDLFLSDVYDRQLSLINNPCAFYVQLVMDANAPIKAERQDTFDTPLHKPRALSLELLIATTSVCAHIDEQARREAARRLIKLGQL